MLPKRKIGFGYIVGKLIISSVSLVFGTGVITFQKRSGKFLSGPEARYPQYGK